jgi:DNA-directed RNA polymerase II subunit RPB2
VGSTLLFRIPILKKIHSIISHGAASFLRERLLLVSDAYRVHVCDTCGMLAIADLENRRHYCKACSANPERHKNGVPPKIVQIVIPYAGKLLFQELLSMLIMPRIVV